MSGDVGRKHHSAYCRRAKGCRASAFGSMQTAAALRGIKFNIAQTPQEGNAKNEFGHTVEHVAFQPQALQDLQLRVLSGKRPCTYSRTDPQRRAFAVRSN